MALPKLNQNPLYELTIPSTNKKVRYRPFLVKEEKVLMIAMESQDQKQALNAIADTVVACVDDKIDKYSLTMFDVEYMFLKIRAKSVGETSTVGVACSSCETQNEITIPLDDIKIEVKKTDKNIQLTPEVSVEMRYPTFMTMANSVSNSSTSTDIIFSAIAECIEAIVTDEERILAKDTPAEEMVEFIESMNTAQFEKIRTFAESIPKLSHEVKFECGSCSAENTLVLEGIQDFF
jgi:hypothetical protein